MLTLHGMGGIGKSRTSLEVGHHQLRQTRGILSPSSSSGQARVERSSLFIDGIFFIALDALTSADMIPSAIAEALDVDMQGLDDVLTQVKTFIGKKKLLLILDNFEHLMEGATLASDLLAACPELKIMVTSREVLKLEEEWVKDLEGLQYPPSTTMTLKEAQHFEAVKLFSQRAKKAVLEFSANEDNIATIVEICQLVEGAPLALELAATWVRVMTLSEIAKEIRSNLSFLENQNRNKNERHQSIRAVFEHSWKLLTPKEQDVFRKLSVFVGSFNRQAASEVAGATLPILVSLVNKSLLRVMQNGRYSRHFLIYEFSQEKLKELPDEFVQTRQHHATYYCNFLSSNSEAILGAEQKTVLEQLDFEIDNIYRAWPQFFESKDSEQLRQTINTLCEYLSVKGRSKEGISLFISTLERIENTNHEDILVLGILNKCIAKLYNDTGNLIKAQHFAEQSLNILQDSNFLHEKAWALRILGVVYKGQGQFVQAKECLDKELAIYQKENNLLYLAATMNNLGVLYTTVGQYDEAEVCILESIRIDRQINNLSGVVTDLASLGHLYLLTHRANDAENVVRESLNLANEVGDVWATSFLFNGLGIALYQKGKVDESKKWFHKALKHAEGANESGRLIEIFTSLAMLKVDTRDFTHVERYLIRSLTLAKTLNMKSDMLFTLVEAGKFLITQGQIELARQVAEFISNAPEAWKSAKEQAEKLLLTCNELSARPDLIPHESSTNLSPSLITLLVEILENQPTLMVIG